MYNNLKNVINVNSFLIKLLTPTLKDKKFRISSSNFVTLINNYFSFSIK